MRELSRTKETKTYLEETLEVSYENQEEFDKHNTELRQQGWNRDIYSHIYNHNSGKHECVFYYRNTEVERNKWFIVNVKVRFYKKVKIKNGGNYEGNKKIHGYC